MQDDKNDITSSLENHTTYDTLPEASWNGTRGYNGYAASSGRLHGVREQAQEYALPEHAPYEYGNVMSSRMEKVTSLPPRKSQKGWWAAIALTAVVFFLLGGGISQWVMPVSVMPMPFQQKIGSFHVQGSGGTVYNSPLGNPQYAPIVVKEVSDALKLSPAQIRMQVKQGKSLADIATEQGVSLAQLHDIETKAFQDMTNAEVNAGDIDQNQANKLMESFQSDPGALDRETSGMFFMGFNGN